MQSVKLVSSTKWNKVNDEVIVYGVRKSKVEEENWCHLVIALKFSLSNTVSRSLATRRMKWVELADTVQQVSCLILHCWLEKKAKKKKKWTEKSGLDGGNSTAASLGSRKRAPSKNATRGLATGEVVLEENWRSWRQPEAADARLGPRHPFIPLAGQGSDRLVFRFRARPFDNK